MPVAWHTNKWWGWYKSKDEKKEKDPMFIEEYKIVLVVYTFF